MTALATNGTEIVGRAIKDAIKFVKRSDNSLSKGDPAELRRHELAFNRATSISTALFSLTGSVIQDISDRERLGTNKREMDRQDSYRFGAVKDMFQKYVLLGLYEFRADKAISPDKLVDGQEVVVVQKIGRNVIVHGKGTKISKDDTGNFSFIPSDSTSAISINDSVLIFEAKVEDEVNKQLSMIWNSALRDLEDAFNLVIKEEKARLNPNKAQRKTLDRSSIQRVARIAADGIISDINNILDSAEKLIRDDLVTSYTKAELVESIEDTLRRNEIPNVSLQDLRTLITLETLKAGDEVVKISELSEPSQRVYRIIREDAEVKGRLVLSGLGKDRTESKSRTVGVIKVETLDKIKDIIKQAMVSSVDRQRSLFLYAYTEALTNRRNSLKASLSNIVKKIFGVKPDGRETFREAIRIRSAENEVLNKLQVPLYVKYRENALPLESFRDGQDVIVVDPETYLLEEGVRLVQTKDGRWNYRVYRSENTFADYILDPEYLVFDPLQSHVIDESVEALAKGAIGIFHTTLEMVMNQESRKRTS